MVTKTAWIETNLLLYFLFLVNERMRITCAFLMLQLSILAH